MIQPLVIRLDRWSGRGIVRPFHRAIVGNLQHVHPVIGTIGGVFQHRTKVETAKYIGSHQRPRRNQIDHMRQHSGIGLQRNVGRNRPHQTNRQMGDLPFDPVGKDYDDNFARLYPLRPEFGGH